MDFKILPKNILSLKGCHKWVTLEGIIFDFSLTNHSVSDESIPLTLWQEILENEQRGHNSILLINNNN